MLLLAEVGVDKVQVWHRSHILTCHKLDHREGEVSSIALPLACHEWTPREGMSLLLPWSQIDITFLVESFGHELVREVVLGGVSVHRIQVKCE
jgi:hypothetical protein